MCKVGILTFSNTLNFGAELQCYALSEFLKSAGHDVLVIDYRNEKIEVSGKRRFAWVHDAKTFALWMLSKSSFAKREALFEAFSAKYLDRTSTFDAKTPLTEDELAIFDAVIVGSDQVWNFEITGKDLTYLLDFDKEKAHTRKISYAASFGKGGLLLDEDSLATLSALLGDFDAISVREATGADIVCEATGTRPEVVVDPTLLVDKSCWEPFSTTPSERISSVLPEQYVLAYIIGERSRVVEKAHLTAKEKGLPLVCLQTGSIHKTADAIDIQIASPEDFVYLVAHASAVITDSFHGTCFSIIFEKELESVLSANAAGKNSRIVDMLESLHMVQCCQGVGSFAPDYKEVDAALQDMRAASAAFLRAAI